MIKLFRKIRYDLIEKNKTGKYIKYAIGEIILVVIGILIALSINNWNENQINNLKETEILLGLKNEFENNLEALIASNKFSLNSNKACFALTQIIQNDQVSSKSNIVDSLIKVVINFSAFEAKTGMTDEIINSGKLNLLKNEKLRNRLTLWSGILRNAKGDYKYRSDNYTDNLMPFLMSRLPLSNIESNKKLISNTGIVIPMYSKKSRFTYKLSDMDLMEFENQIWHHKHNQDYVIMNDYNIQDFIKNTIELLKEEIN
jgi:hypothetical protein